MLKIKGITVQLNNWLLFFRHPLNMFLSLRDFLYMFKYVGIVGAGTMGTGIAQLTALSKMNVLLFDVNETLLRRSLERIKANLRKCVNLGQLTLEELTATIERIRTHTSLPDLGHCDYIIESVIEDIRVKKDLFKHLDANAKSTTILASTTSSLSITSIASSTLNPEHVVGIHFFNPVDTTTLVEIVKGHKTNDETISQAIAFASLLGKGSIVVKDTPGLITGRISQPIFSEALRVLGEHIADAEQVDRILKTIGGFQSGPFEIMDQMGIDTSLAVAQSLYDQSYHESRFRPHPMLRYMVESGLLGKKSGKGFFDYQEEK
jgi:3-hydroxybutyryl-CoA dehydrogenase